jgi:hypothetical protein
MIIAEGSVGSKMPPMDLLRFDLRHSGELLAADVFGMLFRRVKTLST